MQGLYSVTQIRDAEQALMAELPPGTLMRRAAYALSLQCGQLLPCVYGSPVVLLVGSGNNGGDALFAGAYLSRRGARVRALLLAPERTHADGLAALTAAGGRAVSVPRSGASASALGALIARADLVVDGIVGIGGSGGLAPAAAQLAQAARGVLTVAVDLPSGIDADTGAVDGAAIRADVTVTMGAIKAGLAVGAARALVGDLRVVDIGLGPYLSPPVGWVLSDADVAAVLPRPSEQSDKYTRGVLGVVAGSAQYAGAGVLATGSAISGGAGMVRYLGRAPEQIKARYPEVVTQSGTDPSQVKVQAWVVGPGLGVDAPAEALLVQVLATEVPVVIDADAITILSRRPELVQNRRAATVLTPHDREFTRLGLELTGDRIGSARRAAERLGVTMLLKGDATVVVSPQGETYVNRTGTAWLATAGSGDVLSGLIGSLLAAGLEPVLAAAVGAHVHGRAGAIAAADGPPSAADLMVAIRAARRSLSR